MWEQPVAGYVSRNLALPSREERPRGLHRPDISEAAPDVLMNVVNTEFWIGAHSRWLDHASGRCHDRGRGGCEGIHPRGKGCGDTGWPDDSAIGHPNCGHGAGPRHGRTQDGVTARSALAGPDRPGGAQIARSALGTAVRSFSVREAATILLQESIKRAAWNKHSPYDYRPALG